MATIKFKAKLQIVGDDSFVAVPMLTRNHCDMSAFRTHPKYGAYANSDLFPALLQRIRRQVAPSGLVRPAAPPNNVTVDTSSFLAVVTIEV